MHVDIGAAYKKSGSSISKATALFHILFNFPRINDRHSLTDQFFHFCFSRIDSFCFFKHFIDPISRNCYCSRAIHKDQISRNNLNSSEHNRHIYTNRFDITRAFYWKCSRTIHRKTKLCNFISIPKTAIGQFTGNAAQLCPECEKRSPVQTS